MHAMIKDNKMVYALNQSNFTWSLLLYLQPINKLTSQCEIRKLTTSSEFGAFIVKKHNVNPCQQVLVAP